MIYVIFPSVTSASHIQKKNINLFILQGLVEFCFLPGLSHQHSTGELSHSCSCRALALKRSAHLEVLVECWQIYYGMFCLSICIGWFCVGTLLNIWDSDLHHPFAGLILSLACVWQGWPNQYLCHLWHSSQSQWSSEDLPPLQGHAVHREGSSV